MSELARSRKQLKGKMPDHIINRNVIYVAYFFLLIKTVYLLDLLLHGPRDIVKHLI